MKMRKDVVTRFFISAFMIITGTALWILKLYALGGGIILAGVVLFLSNFYYAKKPETEILYDEMMRRIDEKAGYHAFWITIIILTILFWICKYSSYKNVRFTDVYSIVLFTGLYAWIILRFYYSKKGILE